jgi:uncharacterized small protein (DUF1192 family)
MRDEDPFAPAPPRPVKLDEMSVSDLKDRIEALQDEIRRCEAMIAAKSSARAAADSVFGRPGSAG